MAATDVGREPSAGGRIPMAFLPTEAHEVEVVLLDSEGVVVSVNDAWWRFCIDNGGDPARVGPGTSYLSACDSAAGDPSADQVAGAVRAALRDDLPAPVTVSVPCHGPDAWRWFDVLVSPRKDDQGVGVGAVVTLSLARSVPVQVGRNPEVRDFWTGPSSGGTDPALRVRTDYREDRCERLGDDFALTVLDLAPVGILVLDEEGVVLRAGRRAEAMFGFDTGELVGTPVARVLPELAAGSRPCGGGAPVSSPGGTPSTGVLRDGVQVAVRVAVGRVALSRGAGTVVMVEPAPPDPEGAVARLDGVADDLERSLDGLLGCSLQLAGVVGRLSDGEDVGRRARNALAELDIVVGGLRSALVSCRAIRGDPMGPPPSA